MGYPSGEKTGGAELILTFSLNSTRLIRNLHLLSSDRLLRTPCVRF